MIAPARIRGRPPAPRVRAVDYVVVDQRGAVKQFHDGGKPDGSFAARSRITVREQQQRRPQPLSPAAQKIRCDFRDRLESGRALPRQFLLDEREIVPHQLKNLFRCQKRDGLPPGRHHFVGDSADAASLRRAIRKKRRKFSAVLEAASSGVKFLTLATVFATSAT